MVTNVVMALLVSTQGRGDQHFLPLLPCFLLTFFSSCQTTENVKNIFQKIFSASREIQL